MQRGGRRHVHIKLIMMTVYVEASVELSAVGVLMGSNVIASVVPSHDRLVTLQ